MLSEKDKQQAIKWAKVEVQKSLKTSYQMVRLTIKPGIETPTDRKSDALLAAEYLLQLTGERA